MRTRKVKVAKHLIEAFYPHPEAYGDFVVDLINGMYTDVYENEDGTYFTITNDRRLIKYLRKNRRKIRKSKTKRR